MSTLYDKIIEQRGSVENLVARIPGFKGYHEKQARRTADRLLRDYIAGQIQECVNRFVRVEKKVLDNTGIKFMSKTRDIKMVIQTYHDRVKTAAPKYSGMFAQIKIDTNDLERIYSFDEAQIRYVDMLNEALDSLEQSVVDEDKLQQALDSVYEVAVEANDAFKLRDDVITQLNSTL